MKSKRRNRAYVIEQIPHPMLGPAPFVVVVWQPEFAELKMDRRRIKREMARAMREWKMSKQCS